MTEQNRQPDMGEFVRHLMMQTMTAPNDLLALGVQYATTHHTVNSEPFKMAVMLYIEGYRGGKEGCCSPKDLDPTGEANPLILNAMCAGWDDARLVAKKQPQGLDVQMLKDAFGDNLVVIDADNDGAITINGEHIVGMNQEQQRSDGSGAGKPSIAFGEG